MPGIVLIHDAVKLVNQAAKDAAAGKYRKKHESCAMGA
jgi:hypothetical protein